MLPRRALLAMWMTTVSACSAAGSLPLITTRHGTEEEVATKKQLESLFSRYDLAPFMVTTTIEIDRDAIPHSHPVLTLHTRHRRDDLLLLSTLVHEEAHWLLEQRPAQTDAAVTELKARYPELPVGFPDGANDLRSSYEHLLVISLEERAMRRLVGELAARQVMEFWSHDHYRALYRIVLGDGRDIGAIVSKHGLSVNGSSNAGG